MDNRHTEMNNWQSEMNNRRAEMDNRHAEMNNWQLEMDNRRTEMNNWQSDVDNRRFLVAFKSSFSVFQPYLVRIDDVLPKNIGCRSQRNKRMQIHLCHPKR